MIKVNVMFMLVMLDYVSDWYSIHKISTKTSQQLNRTFDMINKLRGKLRDELEGNGGNHEIN